MAQYQSFPDAPGDSRTLEKLKALKLPDLAGRRFLDVGCNEGFFCGFAGSQGAGRVVGIDQSRPFLDRARRRFPGCEFYLQGWDRLPEGRFDVILLASALHYAQDQAALLRQLVGKLSTDGVLVVELGIVSNPKSEWVKVERGIDQRYFPTMAKLREILSEYAWKWMGPSVSQSGDPVARHVIHISRRRPVAYLLMQPPGYGKSSICARLFAPVGVPVVSGDQLINLVAQGKQDAPEALRRLIAQDYSPFHIDQTIQRVFEQGGGRELIGLWMSQAGNKRDFALDVYVPDQHHPVVEEAFSRMGYLPVLMRWQKAGPSLPSAETQAERVESFYESLSGDPQLPVGASPPAPGSVVGFIDEVLFEQAGLTIRGWAMDGAGQLPGQLEVHIQGKPVPLTAMEAQERPDVQRRRQLAHAKVGYLLRMAVDGAGCLEDIDGDIEVSVASGQRLQLTARAAKQLGVRG